MDSGRCKRPTRLSVVPLGAVTVFVEFMVTLQVAAVDVPPVESQPDQVTVDPVFAVAVSVTGVPGSKNAAPVLAAG